jgi:hypothetical protein
MRLIATPTINILAIQTVGLIAIMNFLIRLVLE